MNVDPRVPGSEPFGATRRWSWTTVILLGLALPVSAWAVEPGIEHDIRSLDDATRQALVHDMLNQLDSGAGEAEASTKNGPDGSPRTARAIEEDIRALDPETRRNMAQEALRRLEADHAPEETTVAASGGVIELSAGRSGQAGLRPPRRILESQLRAAALPIVRQPRGHILITVGDLVYLSADASSQPAVDRSYAIYAFVRETQPETGKDVGQWYEQVGRVRILETGTRYTVAKVMQANRPIHTGDVVLVRPSP